MRRLAGFLLLFTLAPGAFGYYFFVQYSSRNAPFTPIYSKFHLNALPGGVIPFLIAADGPSAWAPGDSFPALVSQIRLAAKTWSDVPSSRLRLQFAGFSSPGVAQSSPAIEVIFDDLPPGVVALGGPTLREEPVTAAGETFVPILRSTVVLGRNLSQRPSWSENYFLSLVHEFGHALGLQHSLASSAMSTELTRATTKAKPLATDDIAGITLLYPAAAATGATIQGRVTEAGVGVSLASVVAISMDGNTISALTNPDGTYRIENIPPGIYQLYAHPLPPAISGESFPAGITPPSDFDNRFFSPSPAFQTVFHPGVTDPQRANSFLLTAGSVVEGLNFAVTRRAAPALYGVTTYSFPEQIAVKPAHLSLEGGRNFLVATGYGLTPAAGVQVLGGSVIIPAGGVRPYPPDARYLQIDLGFSLLSGEGARHLAFNANNDLYVLPSAFRLTRRLPPAIAAIAPAQDGAGTPSVVISGERFSRESVFLFDGVPGVLRAVDEAGVTAVVRPPPGMSGQRSAVVVLNPDGQSSLFLQTAAAAATYDHDGGDIGSLTVSPAQVAAGVESMVEIQTSGAPLTADQLHAALGSSGIYLRRLWLTGANRLVANIVVAPTAAPGASTVSVLHGLRLSNAPAAFTVTPATARQSTFRGAAVDAVTGRPDIPAGAVAQVRIAGPVAELPAAALSVTVAERPATIVSLSGGLLSFTIPPGLAPGPAVLRLTATGAEPPPPIVIGIDVPPPVITQVFASGVPIDAARPARPGELLSMVVAGLAEPGQEIAPSRVTVQVGGAQHPAAQVAAQPSGTHLVQFVLDPTTAAGTLPLAVAIDGRLSAPVSLPVRLN
jgi:hypothetical protein